MRHGLSLIAAEHIMVTALGIACLQLTEKILWVKDQYMCLGGNIGPVKISLWCGQDAAH